jgi:hypothetical protein
MADTQMAEVQSVEGKKVQLLLLGNPIVEWDGELVCGLLLTPEAARELAVGLIENAYVAEQEET